MVMVPPGTTASAKSPLLLGLHGAPMVPGPVPPMCPHAGQSNSGAWGLCPKPRWHLQALGWAHSVAQARVHRGAKGLAAPWVGKAFSDLCPLPACSTGRE